MDNSSAVLFGDLIQMEKHFIEFGEELDYWTDALWLMAGYIYPLFETFPYLFITGLQESGKTKTLRFLSELAFNSEMTSNMTPAALFRVIESKQPTLCVDESEHLSIGEVADEFRNMLLSGYQEGNRVYRVGGENRERVDTYKLFCPKAIANIGGLDGVLESRCIKRVMMKASDAEVAARRISPKNPLWSETRSRIYLWALENWRDVARVYLTVIEGERPAGISGREWEIWRPLLSVAYCVDRDKVFRPLLKHIEKQEVERAFAFADEHEFETALLQYLLDTWPSGKLVVRLTGQQIRDSLGTYFGGPAPDWLTKNSKKFGRSIQRMKVARSWKGSRGVRGWDFEREKVEAAATRFQLKKLVSTEKTIAPQDGAGAVPAQQNQQKIIEPQDEQEA